MDKKTEEHREIYPLSLDHICKMSSFEQVFGRSIDDYNEAERKERWEKVTSFEGGQDVKEHYEDSEACQDCRHLNNGWCNYASLPCGINPTLTFGTGMLGMACQGVGYEGSGQVELDFEENDLPF